MHRRKKKLGLDGHPTAHTFNTAFHLKLDHNTIARVIEEMIRRKCNITDFIKEDGE